MIAEKFTEEVLSRLVAEHGSPRSTFEYLIPKITAAHASEGVITMDQLNDLVHGGDGGVPPELEKQFPLLSAVCLSPYTELEDQSIEHEKIDEDEDDEDDDAEDEDDEDED